MDFQMDTTHLIIKFPKQNKTGKESIDLVPVKWTYTQDDELFCKYPNKSDYSKLDEWSRTSRAPGTSWKSFKVTLVKEARDYDQGFRRMQRAFSDEIVQTSNIDEDNSSEEEDDPLLLSESDIQKSLNTILSVKESSHITDSPHNVEHSQPNVSNEEQESVVTSRSSLSVPSERKKLFKKYKKSVMQKDEDSVSSSSSAPSPKRRRILLPPLEKSLNSNPLEILSSEAEDSNSKNLPKLRGKENERNKTTKMSSNTLKKNKNGTQFFLEDKKMSKEQNMCCPNCGLSASEMSLPKSFFESSFESLKRSIEYRIREEGVKTRAAIDSVGNSGHIQQIIQQGCIANLPKNDLKTFLEFEDDLKKNVELVTKLKCFMMLNIKNPAKLADNLSAIIPQIISKSVQLQYSAFGREAHGIQKLNFSSTETYKNLRDVLLTKFPDFQLKELKSQISRWFSGAKDRDGGKRDRIAGKVDKNKRNNEARKEDELDTNQS